MVWLRMYTKDEIRAIDEKSRLLRRIKNGSLSLQELERMITEMRVNWLKPKLKELLEKYKGLNPMEQAWKIICFEHMAVKEGAFLEQIDNQRYMLKSYSFCPYLEACNSLGLETKIICREANETGFNEMCKMIHPDLRFERDYSHIRPERRVEFCKEFFVMV